MPPQQAGLGEGLPRDTGFWEHVGHTTQRQRLHKAMFSGLIQGCLSTFQAVDGSQVAAQGNEEGQPRGRQLYPSPQASSLPEDHLHLCQGRADRKHLAHGNASPAIPAPLLLPSFLSTKDERNGDQLWHCSPAQLCTEDGDAITARGMQPQLHQGEISSQIWAYPLQG